MTRFARAKGSKASNERLPNEATPWHIMKQQLEDNISSKNSQPEKAKTAKQLLKENDDPFYYDTTGNVNNDWAEFERPKTETSAKRTVKGETKSKGEAKGNKNKIKRDSSGLENGISDVTDLAGSDVTVEKKKKLKKEKLDSSLQKLEGTAVDSAISGINSAELDSKVGPKGKSMKCKPNISSVETVKIAINSLKVEDNNTEADGSVSPKMKSKKRKSDASTEEAAQPEAERSIKIEKADEAESEPKKKSKKRKSDVSSEEAAQPEAECSMTIEKADEAGSEPKKKKKKKNRSKEKKCDSAAKNAKIIEETQENGENESEKVKTSTETSGKMSKRQKRNQKRKNKISDENANGEKSEAPFSGGFDAAGNDWSSNVNFGKQRTEKKSNGQAIQNQGVGDKDTKKPPNRFNAPGDNAVKRKAPKIRDDKEHKRRKPDSGAIKCTINGMDVEIVKYDGFPVKKEDAERLKDLRQQMVLKGIPKSEIDAAMKLERRKAEKSLARVRKQVCFHCRKAGHNLSDCPELGEGESATGICFKCGSTEHTHFECKVTKKQEYGFASCFICREQGHIAKQCPDNPKGLYPQGGSCKICGDVTHLRKDCPDLTKEKEESAMTLNTIAESTLESLDEDVTRKSAASDDGKRTKGKVVKF